MNEFEAKCKDALEALFLKAKETEEFGYAVSLLYINSGAEDAGWQPITETLQVCSDITGLVNAPLAFHTQLRLLLFLYAHILESDFIPHVLNNLLRVVQQEVPLVWQFLDKWRTKEGKKIPPSAKVKLSEVINTARDAGFVQLVEVFEECIDWKIRNAFFHSDYVLWEDKIRFKHGGYSQIEERSADELVVQINKLIVFFDVFIHLIQKHKQSYSEGYIISGRQKDGRNLGSIKLLVDPQYGLIGFSQSDSLPTW